MEDESKYLLLAYRLRKVCRAKELNQQLGRIAGTNYTTISWIESGEAKQVGEKQSERYSCMHNTGSIA